MDTYILCRSPRKNDTEEFVNWQCRKCIFSLLPFYNFENKEYKSNSELINNASVKNKPNIINKPPKYSTCIAGKGFKFAHLNVVSLVKNFEEM